MNLDPPSDDHHISNQRSISSTIDNGTFPITPRRGKLVALRTKAEVENSGLRTIPAYMVEIPQKSASQVLIAVDALVREHDKESINLHHLRRVIKPEHLPIRLWQHPNYPAPDKKAIATARSLSLSSVCPENADVTPNTGDQQSQPALYFLIAATSSIPLPVLSALLSSLFPSPNRAILTIPVPRYPPTSSSQAQEWSQSYWPTIYKKSNPFGPQPSTMQKAEAGMLPMVGQWMGLALQAGKEAEERGMGIGVGAVIVEKGKLVVVAADSRWVGDNFHAPDGNERGKGRGNPMAHAVMRVIGLVARKRRDLLIRQSPSTIGQEAGQKASADIGGMEDHFLDKPLSELEKEAYEGDAVKGGGYLCVDMDIYITHEPCVMCCMAMLHSRFGRVVFVQRMTRTGGLCVEAEAGDNAGGVQGGGDGVGGGLGYGLFWRQELNWRFLAWQWEDEGDDDYQLVREDVHV